jgi:hypothetical protein
VSSTPAVLKPAASPTRAARADALEQIAGWSLYTGGIKLTGAAYQHLGALGLNRAYVSQAADALVKQQSEEGPEHAQALHAAFGGSTSTEASPRGRASH